MGASQLISIDTTGGAGAAIGDGESLPLYGLLTDVSLDYHASAPAGTTVTITYTQGGVTKTVLTVTGNTDLVSHPTHALQDNTDTDTAFVAPHWLEGDRLTVSVTNCNALTGAVKAKFKTM